MEAAKKSDVPFKHNQYLENIASQIDKKETGRINRLLWGRLLEEAETPFRTQAEALAKRRAIKPASFIKRAIFGETLGEKLKLAKYSALNEQLKKIPEIAQYDKLIATAKWLSPKAKAAFAYLVL